MAETRQAGWTRWWCRRCKRPLVFTNKRRDTVTVDPSADKLVFKHDGCGGTVRPSVPPK